MISQTRIEAVWWFAVGFMILPIVILCALVALIVSAPVWVPLWAVRWWRGRPPTA